MIKNNNAKQERSGIAFNYSVPFGVVCTGRTVLFNSQKPNHINCGNNYQILQLFYNLNKSSCSGLLHDASKQFQFTLKKFFSKQSTLAAIAVYITIVSIVYNIILRFLWKPQGLQLIVDELLHSVIPVLFVLFWLVFVPKGNIGWRSVLAWLLYPLSYLIFILLRGPSSLFYPYPFIDVTILGYSKVIINSTGMLLAFLAVSIIFILLDRSKKFKTLHERSNVKLSN